MLNNYSMTYPPRKFAVTFPSKRHPREEQEDAGRAEGATDTLHVGINPLAPTWRKMFGTLVRPGDTLYVYYLALVPTEPGEDKISPTSQLSAFLAECREQGVALVEVVTGRTNATKAEREDMIADAASTLRSGGRRAPPGSIERGRPKYHWPKKGTELRKRALTMWRSKGFVTNAEAAAAIKAEIAGFEAFDAGWGHTLFGASGRSPPGRPKADPEAPKKKPKRRKKRRVR